MTARKSRPCTWPDGCDQQVDTARGGGDGLCAKHYQRVRRAKWYGRPEQAADRAEKAMERAEQAAERAERAAAKQRPIIVGGAPPARGHSRKFTPELQEDYIRHRAEGLLPGEAAKAVGVTMFDVQAVRKADPGFVDREKAAQELAAEPFIRRQMEIALAGDNKALRDVLANLSEEWHPAERVQKVEVSGQASLVVEPGQQMARILELQAKLEERKALGSGQPTPQIESAGEVVDVEAWDED